MANTEWWIITIIGIIGALIAVIAFCPQSLKTIKTKKKQMVFLYLHLFFIQQLTVYEYYGALFIYHIMADLNQQF